MSPRYLSGRLDLADSARTLRCPPSPVTATGIAPEACRTDVFRAMTARTTCRSRDTVVCTAPWGRAGKRAFLLANCRLNSAQSTPNTPNSSSILSISTSGRTPADCLFVIRGLSIAARDRRTEGRGEAKGRQVSIAPSGARSLPPPPGGVAACGSRDRAGETREAAATRRRRVAADTKLLCTAGGRGARREAAGWRGRQRLERAPQRLGAAARPPGSVRAASPSTWRGARRRSCR